MGANTRLQISINASMLHETKQHTVPKSNHLSSSTNKLPHVCFIHQTKHHYNMYAAYTNGKLHLVATRMGSQVTQGALPSSHTWQQTESHVLRWHTNESCSRLNHLLVHWILQFTVHITTSYILHQIPGWCIHHWLIYGTEQTQVQGMLRSQLPDCNFIR